MDKYFVYVLKNNCFQIFVKIFIIIYMILLVFLNFQIGDESFMDLNLFKMVLCEVYNCELEFYEQQEVQIVKQLVVFENDWN